jgi:MarR family transcriptional regulator, negative regulator of the multidrug operon emrRAB
MRKLDTSAFVTFVTGSWVNKGMGKTYDSRTYQNVCFAHMSQQTRISNVVGALALAIVDGFSIDVSAGSGLPPFDAAALNVIGFQPDCSIRTLAAMLQLSHPGAVRCVDRLELGGLVERRQGADHRTVALRLTRTGRARWNALRDARMAWLTNLIGELPTQQQQQLGDVAAVLLKQLAPTTEVSDRVCRLCDETVCTPEHCPIAEPYALL